MDLDRKVVIEMAKLLVRTECDPVAHRYLTVLRRRARLRAGLREAQKLGQRDNALKMIFFRPPLSVAGSNSDIIVRAEGLRLRGIPIATEFDTKQRHRGTSIDEAAEALAAETGRHWSERETLEEYADFMATCPAAIHLHHERRFAKIPRLLEQGRVERDALELLLWEIIKSHSPRMFSAAVDGEALNEALVGLKGSVVLGYAGLGGQLRVNGQSIPTSWGDGRGLAVVSASDLRALAGGAGTVAVIDCSRDGWQGWVSENAAALVKSLQDYEQPEPKRFRYFQS